MGRETTIGWCHHTFNVWNGCWKISPGCQNCYAAAMDEWLGGGKHWGRTDPRKFFGREYWRKPLAWNRSALAAKERRRVFCSSTADVFEIHPHPEINAAMNVYRGMLWDLIRITPGLDWLLLTKRIENAADFLPWQDESPWSNVWLGATVEDDHYARQRLPILRRTRAHVRFVSYEPALGRVNWAPHLRGEGHPDWVIFGDESGRNRRDTDPELARETRDACDAAGVKYYFKQWCGKPVAWITGERVNKKIHLPVLDGRVHADFPEKHAS